MFLDLSIGSQLSSHENKGTMPKSEKYIYNIPPTQTLGIKKGRGEDIQDMLEN